MKRPILGPGLLVTAAFIGPGTVVAAGRSGAEFGYSLLWAIAFSVVATMILQEMAARLGIVTGSGLGESLNKMFSWKPGRILSAVLIIAAIFFGNAAYQTGNLLGASLGGQMLTGMDLRITTTLLAVTAGCLLLIGNFSVIKNVLVGIVCLMSCFFVFSALLGKPDASMILSGFAPTIPDGATMLVVGLIGTTVVPYNLFLHASAAAKAAQGNLDKGQSLEAAIRHARWDTWLAIGLGGIVTASVMITTANAFAAEPSSFADAPALAEGLRPLLGDLALNLFALGLLAAGLTSAITAPWAAALATAGCLGWKADLSDWRTKSVALSIVVVGLICGLRFGASPIQTICFAQVANGLLLPLITIYLLFAVNRTDIIGEFRNRIFANIAGTVVLLITIGLGLKMIVTGIGKLF